MPTGGSARRPCFQATLNSKLSTEDAVSQPRAFSTPVFIGTTIALLALVAFVYAGIYFLLVFVPVVVYVLWYLINKVRSLEKRMDEQGAR